MRLLTPRSPCQLAHAKSVPVVSDKSAPADSVKGVPADSEMSDASLTPRNVRQLTPITSSRGQASVRTMEVGLENFVTRAGVRDEVWTSTMRINPCQLAIRSPVPVDSENVCAS